MKLDEKALTEWLLGKGFPDVKIKNGLDRIRKAGKPKA